MLRRTPKILSYLAPKPLLTSIPAYSFSTVPNDKKIEKEIHDQIVRSNTLAKTAFKSFVDAQDLMNYFPVADPVRVSL
jgi:hypothetical protein